MFNLLATLLASLLSTSLRDVTLRCTTMSRDSDLENNGGYLRAGSPRRSTTPTDSCPSDDSTFTEDELPELKKFSPPKHQERRRSSIQRIIELVMEKEEVRLELRVLLRSFMGLEVCVKSLV